MAWHRCTLVVIGLTASLCIQEGKSDDNIKGQTPAPEAVCGMESCLSAVAEMVNKMKITDNTCGDLNELACHRFVETPDARNARGLEIAADVINEILLANEMRQKMNLSADPCEDFNEFACGRFNKETEIPNGRSEVWALTTVADVNTMTVNDMIAKAAKPTDPQYLINIKRFYNSCFDEDTIETVGLMPYLTDSEFVDDWPTRNPSWSGVNFDLNEVIIRYSKVFIDPIFRLATMNDIADSNRVAIYLFGATLTLDLETYNLPRNDTILQAYEKYLVDIAVALNASREVAEQDARDVVDLEIELAKIMVPVEEQRDITKVYNPVQLIELSTMYPELDIVRFARTVFGLVNITLADNETVINAFPTYIGNISRVVQQFSNRTLQNLFGFNYAINRVGVLTRRMRHLTQDFHKVYYGTVAESLRCKFCVDSATAIFSDGISKQYVCNHFSVTAKQNVNDMIDKLKQVFHSMIEKATWMSNATKTEALEKLAAMKRKIGYPDGDFEEADIEEKYRQYIMKADDYYGNKVLGHKLSKLADLATYGKPANKNKWFMPPHETDAYYGWLHNEIVFLAGIMQPPFYSEKFIPAMNYGAIGAVIGHEIMNGFDDEGKQFDENGTFRNWWAPEDQEDFENKTQCIVDQISKIYIDEINMTLNGERTKAKSMDDIGGLKLAFRAYKKYVNTLAQPSRIPGVYLSRDQVFFVSFAQIFCGKYTHQGLVYLVKSGQHLPGKYRILGVLQNSEDFAKAYNCPKGSFMNPVDKCNVW